MTTALDLARIFLTILAALGVIAVLACVGVGIMAMGHFFNINRRPVDDQPPASWIAKQRGDQ